MDTDLIITSRETLYELIKRAIDERDREKANDDDEVKILKSHYYSISEVSKILSKNKTKRRKVTKDKVVAFIATGKLKGKKNNVNEEMTVKGSDLMTFRERYNI